MNDRELSLFVDVVECGSFTSAAKKHYVTPQSVSQRIRRLEAELGFVLFDRAVDGATPTKAGLAFYDGCKRIVPEFDELVVRCRRMHHSESRIVWLGTLKMASLSVFSAFLPDFIRTHPEVTVKYVAVGPNDVEELRRGAFDVLESAIPVGPVGESLGLPDGLYDGLGFLPLFKARRCCMLAPQSPLAHKASISLEDLKEKQVYVYRLDWASDLQAYLLENRPDIKLRAMPTKDAHSLERIYGDPEAVLLLPEHLADRLESFVPVVPVPFDFDFWTEYGLLYRESDRDLVAPLLDYASGYFGGRYHEGAACQDAVALAAQSNSAFWIADEVVTGLGRTGRLFAFKGGDEPSSLFIAPPLTISDSELEVLFEALDAGLAAGDRFLALQ